MKLSQFFIILFLSLAVASFVAAGLMMKANDIPSAFKVKE